MTNRMEDVLLASLTDVDALEQIVRVGIPAECIPTAAIRPVVSWGIQQFLQSGRTKAPSRAALLETWSAVLEEAEVELLPEDEEIDNATWAVETLKDRFAHYQFQDLWKGISTEMSKASPTERIATLSRESSKLGELVLKLQSSDSHLEGIQALDEAMEAYDVREASGNETYGLTFGMPEIDHFTFGIHPGEIAVIAGGAKAGKSYHGLKYALNEWKCDRCTVLFTLENSMALSRDRLAPIVAGVSQRKFQRGELSAEEKTRLKEAREELYDRKDKLHLISPQESSRTPVSLVQTAQSLGADSLIVDQFTFVEYPGNPGNKSETYQVKDKIHQFATLISTGGHPMPMVLLHQLSREGMKTAAKDNKVEKWHVADSVEVERTATWLIGLMANEGEVIAGLSRMQILASRRTELMGWELSSNMDLGVLTVIRELGDDDGDS